MTNSAVLHPCATPRCSRLLHRGEQCPDHPRRDTRPSARKRGYDAEWERIRKQVLSEESNCAVCGEIGLPNDHVDHRNGNPHDRSRTNLRRLHERCHNARTAGDQGRSTPGWVKHERPAPVFG